MKSTILLIAVHFSTSAKFHGYIKISQKKAYSAAWLEISQPAENCGGPTDDTQLRYEILAKVAYTSP